MNPDQSLLIVALITSAITLIGVIVIAIKVFAKSDASQELRTTSDRIETSFRSELAQLEARSAAHRQETYQWLNSNLESRLSHVVESSAQHSASMSELLASSFNLQNQRFDGFAELLTKLTESNERKLEELRNTMDRKLESLQTDNNAKLEQMRQTVEEKLQSTLESRLTESFKLVQEQLQSVHTAMGEMQTLTKQVGSLQSLMSNVKDRGGWGEFQLAAILEQFLHASQYEANVATKEGSGERVEFAIKLPGAGESSAVWLPIDAKFPKEDYERLQAAIEASDTEAQKTSRADLYRRLKGCARDIRDKYINPPNTTDFAIMFLPTEGLYAEALREPGLADAVQREFRVVISGPSTLVALLNSLQMGFRTLAIQERSSQVWEILGTVKTEFDRFGDWLSKVREKFAAASKELDKVDTRTRMMRSKLRGVDGVQVEGSLPPTEPDEEQGSENDASMQP
jgi:DNA recombination protein RmuC